LVRFAGNEVGVKYQVEQVRGLVIVDDASIWSAIAAAPLNHHTSVLPTKLPAFIKDVDGADALWQVGAADGRIRMSDNTLRRDRKSSADFLMQRVKQQLDPSNLFMTRTTS